jgi:NAD(P)H-dependent FMN reductase
VLVVAGISTRSIDRALTDAGAQCLQNGVTLNVFDGLACLPSYSETLESRQLPRAVAALRSAARDAHAAIVLTDYYGQIPATVHNAIDWLTGRYMTNHWPSSAPQKAATAEYGRAIKPTGPAASVKPASSNPSQ